MQRTSFEDVTCSVAQCLDVVGEWWSLLIVRDAFLGVTRFDDFQARLGISRNIRENNDTEASVLKLLWSRWHQELGELAMDVLGAPSMVARGAPYDLDDWQRLFLFSRADTIYGGSDEIQRSIIAERALGLPRQARMTSPADAGRPPGMTCWTARWSSSPPRPAPASARPPPGAAWKKAPGWRSATSTSGGSPRPATSSPRARRPGRGRSPATSPTRRRSPR